MWEVGSNPFGIFFFQKNLIILMRKGKSKLSVQEKIQTLHFLLKKKLL